MVSARPRLAGPALHVLLGTLALVLSPCIAELRVMEPEEAHHGALLSLAQGPVDLDAASASVQLLAHGDAPSADLLEGDEFEDQWIVALKFPVPAKVVHEVNQRLRTAAEASYSRAQLRVHTPRLGEYIPHGSYMLVASREVALSVLDVTGVRGVVPFAPAYKIDDRISESSLLLEQDRASSTRHLVVTLSSTASTSAEEALARAARLAKAWARGAEVLLSHEQRDAGGSGGGVVDSVVVSSASRLVVSLAPGGVAPSALRALVRWLSLQREVHWVEPHAQPAMLNHFSHSLCQSANRSFTPVWDAGLRGQGVVVAVGDTGVDYELCFFKDANVDIADCVNKYCDSHRKLALIETLNNPKDFSDESQGHGSHTAGSIAGATEGPLAKYNGMAPEARLAIFDFGSRSNLKIPTDLYGKLFAPSVTKGRAQVLSNSWGDPSMRYDHMSIDADRMLYEFQFATGVFATGNSGTRGGFSLVTPALAKNTLAIGSSTSRTYPGRSAPVGNPGIGCVSSFSSRGPTNDLRIKPDVLAPGEHILSANSAGTTNAHECRGEASLVIKHGTSMAAPVAAGNVALIVQFFNDGRYGPKGPFAPSSDLVRAVAINSGQPASCVVNRVKGQGSGTTPRDQMAPIPSPEQGFGLLTLDKVLPVGPDAAERRDLWVETGVSLRQGESWRGCFYAVAGKHSFKATLAWVDPPSTQTAHIKLINDLDLRVTVVAGEAAGATVFLGNQRAGLAPLADRVNTVEQVEIPADAIPRVGDGSGAYVLVDVHAYHLGHALDGAADASGARQNFSLVITGFFNEEEHHWQCKDAHCPNACSGHGSCTRAGGEGGEGAPAPRVGDLASVALYCECEKGFTGADCSVEAAPLAVTLSRSDAGALHTIKPWTWMFWIVDVPPAWVGGDIQFQMQAEGGGDPDLYVKARGFPSQNDHDGADTRCDSCKRGESSKVTRPIEPPTFDDEPLYFVVGVFGYCCSESTIRVSAQGVSIEDNARAAGAKRETSTAAAAVATTEAPAEDSGTEEAAFFPHVTEKASETVESERASVAKTTSADTSAIPESTGRTALM